MLLGGGVHAAEQRGQDVRRVVAVEHVPVVDRSQSHASGEVRSVIRILARLGRGQVGRQVSPCEFPHPEYRFRRRGHLSAGAGGDRERLKDLDMDLIKPRSSRADLAGTHLPQELLTRFREKRDDVPRPEGPEKGRRRLGQGGGGVALDAAAAQLGRIDLAVARDGAR
ncbi:hypothetical protein [Sphingomonas sp. LB3N6]|uniref:hypothetical protein n=1 Tax=Sphingomonas fucosidasi TaxID=3096164 RepID=UPI002FCC8D83